MLVSSVLRRASLALAACVFAGVGVSAAQARDAASGAAARAEAIMRSAALSRGEAPRATAVERASTERAPTERMTPDVDALRYYALRGRQDRVLKEIERLKALYPGWRQPPNIFDATDPRETALWRVYADGTTADVEAAIARERAADPAFSPPPELVGKLARRAARDEMAAAHAKGEWKRVVALADREPALLMGGDVEAIWFVAEAYAKLKRMEPAREAFAAAHAASKTPEERAGTALKAVAVLPETAAREWRARLKAEDDPRLAAKVERTLAAAAIADATRAGRRAALAVPPERIALFETAVREEADREGRAALLAGWFRRARGEAQASTWFAVAHERGAGPKALEGLALALNEGGRERDALRVLARHGDASPELEMLWLDAASHWLRGPRPDLSRIAAGAEARRHAGAAEALGWYAYDGGQMGAARAWFAEAVAWRETDAGALTHHGARGAGATRGLLLVAKRLRDRVGFEAIKARHLAGDRELATIAYDEPRTRRHRPDPAGRLRGRIARLYEARRYRQCLDQSDRILRMKAARADDHQMRGWCLMALDRPAEAERAFARAVSLGGKGKGASAYGASLAALRNRKTLAGRDAARAGPLTAAQRRTVNVEIFTQRARAAFDEGSYEAALHALDRRARLAREPRDLSILRGWALHHAGRKAAAARVFARLDAQLSTRETRRALRASKGARHASR